FCADSHCSTVCTWFRPHGSSAAQCDTTCAPGWLSAGRRGREVYLRLETRSKTSASAAGREICGEWLPGSSTRSAPMPAAIRLDHAGFTIWSAAQTTEVQGTVGISASGKGAVKGNAHCRRKRLNAHATVFSLQSA